jgi:hypothetical protein
VLHINLDLPGLDGYTNLVVLSYAIAHGRARLLGYHQGGNKILGRFFRKD